MSQNDGPLNMERRSKLTSPPGGGVYFRANTMIIETPYRIVAMSSATMPTNVLLTYAIVSLQLIQTYDAHFTFRYAHFGVKLRKTSRRKHMRRLALMLVLGVAVIAIAVMPAPSQTPGQK